MAKKQEDNRDIFEKALDYAPLVGAVLGGAAGVRASKSWAKKRGEKKAFEFVNEGFRHRQKVRGLNKPIYKYSEDDFDRASRLGAKDMEEARRYGKAVEVVSRGAVGTGFAAVGALAGEGARSSEQRRRDIKRRK